MMISRILATGLTLALLAAPSIAQDEENTLPPPADNSRALPPYEPTWTNPQIAQIARQLSGTWRTEEPIESMRGEDGNTKPVYLVMSIAAAPVAGLADTLYVETARTDSPWTPYRRAIFQIYPYKDSLRLRTYELAVGETADGVFDGMFAAPEHFPDLSADELIATIDLDLELTATGFAGSTPYPYPTRLGGAVEMTSSVTLEGDALSVADRGFDAQGNIAWGAGKDSVFFFERTSGVVSATRRDDGLVILDYGGASGPVVSDGDQMQIHYEGFLKNNHRFDASYERGQPFVFAYPPGSRAITGWGIGMEGFAQGAHRKLIVPGYLGYGPNGNPRANIPADATLYFNVFCAQIDRAAPKPETDVAAPELQD